MAKNKPSIPDAPRKPGQPRSAPAHRPPPSIAAQRAREAAGFSKRIQSGDEIHPLIIGMLGLHVLCLTAIILAMTPLTYQLDDIKNLIFLFAGPVLMLFAVCTMALGVAPWPPRIAGWALAGFGLTLVVSTLAQGPLWKTGNFRWVGWDQFLTFWAAGGFFMSACVVGSNQRASTFFARYLVVVSLMTSLVGIAMFDVMNSNEHKSVVGWLYRHLYRPGVNSQSAFQSLLWTLVNADTTMQSTILNRDFFAGFSLLYIPFSLCMALHPARSRNPYLWRGLGLVAALLSMMCIFWCQSKGEYIVGTCTIAMFMILYLKVDFAPETKRSHVICTMIGVLMLIGSLAWMRFPTLLSQLKSVSYSAGSRKIIWAGAIKIFEQHPILGGGPGTFRIYFSKFRAPDYFNHEISNVTNYAHNYFLDLLSEEGLIGFLCFMTFIGTLMLIGFRYAWTHPDRRMRMVLLACCVGLMGIFGSNLSSPNARWVIGASSLWTVMGFFAGVINLAKSTLPLSPPQLAAANVPHAAPVPESRAAGRRAPTVPAASFNMKHAIPIGALVVVAFVSGGFSWQQGYDYFNSMRADADARSYMDEAYSLIDQGGKLSNEDIVDALTPSYTSFEKAIKIDPTNVSSYYKLGSVYVTLSRDYRSIASHYAQENKTAEASEATRRADDFLLRAKDRYETTLKLWPDYAEIHFNMVIVYRDYAEYIRRHIALHAVDPEHEPALPLTEKDAKDYDALALDHVRQMGQLSNKQEILSQQGQIFSDFGLVDEACNTYERAVGIYKTDLNLANEYSEAAARTKDPKRIAAALTHLWQLEPSNGGTLSNLLKNNFEAHLDKELNDTLTRLEAVNPLHKDLYTYRFKIAERTANHTALASAFENYIKVGGTPRADYFWEGAEAARQANDPNLAKLTYRWLMQSDKDGQSTYGQQSRQRLLMMSGDSSTSLTKPIAK